MGRVSYPADSRPLRGLVIRYAERFADGLPPRNRYDRDLVGPLPPRLRALRDREGNKLCSWCRRSTASRRRNWHETCIRAFFAARGIQHYMNGWPIAVRTPCQECGGPGEELDHRVALSVAWARQDRRALIRAYTLGNLRWLCHDCHTAKTAADRRLYNNIRNGRPDDWEPPVPVKRRPVDPRQGRFELDADKGDTE